MRHTMIDVLILVTYIYEECIEMIRRKYILANDK